MSPIARPKPLNSAYWHKNDLDIYSTVRFFQTDNTQLITFRAKLKDDHTLNNRISDLLIQNIADPNWKTLAQIAPELLLFAFSKLHSTDDQQENIKDYFLKNFEHHAYFRNTIITLLQSEKAMLTTFREKLEDNTNLKIQF